MRRHSPPRHFRRSPPRKRGRGRSPSPLSRNQPLPPGEERGRKTTHPWTNDKHNKRYRSRSREWMEQRHPDPPFINLMDHGSRDRTGKNFARNDGKRRSSDYEESYLDHFGMSDPSMVDYPPLDRREKPREAPARPIKERLSPRPPREAPGPIRERLSPRPSRENNKPRDKSPRSKPNLKEEESAAERIKRLEKLVEKLVEQKSDTKISPSKPKNSIPEFVPSNTQFTTSMWLNIIHEYCLNQNYSEKSCLKFLEEKMTGIMKAWYKTVSHFDFTWPELKLLITKNFPDNVEFAQTLKLLVSRDKQTDETVTQYYFSKLYLCEACKIVGENAVSCLIDGFSTPFVKQEIKSHRFLTPEALYSDYLIKHPEAHIPPIRMEQREVVEMVSDYEEEPDLPEYIPLENHNPRPRNSESKKCYTCKRFGHVALECRHAPICYICNKKGHIAAKCYNNVNLIQTSKTLRAVSCKINGHKLRAIVDTGSAAVIITKTAAEKLSLEPQTTKELLQSFGGSLLTPYGEVQGTIQISGVQRQVNIFVVEDHHQEVEVIVGQEFLAQKGVVLWQKEGQVHIVEC